MHPGGTYVRFLTIGLKIREAPELDWAGEVHDRMAPRSVRFAAVNLKFKLLHARS